MNSPAKMMIVFVDESDTWDDQPLYEAIITQFVSSGVAGATVLAGIAGYGIHGTLHRPGYGGDGQRPVAVVAVDTAEKLGEVTPGVRRMVREGLMLITDVELIPVSGQ